MSEQENPANSKTIFDRLDLDFVLTVAGLGVWEIDPVTNQVFWDNRCRELFGLAKHNNLSYEQVIQYIHADDISRVDQAIRWAMNPQSGSMVDETYRTIGADDGQLRWVRFSGKGYFSEAGKIYRFAGVAQEVTQHVLDQQWEATRKEAQQQQRIHEAITASIPDLMYVFDLNYRFTYANQALLSMWGSTWEKSIGKGLLENGYEPWHAQMHEREIDQVVATKRPIRGEVSFPHATLGKRTYDYVFAPIFNDKGEVEAIAGTTRDITDIKQAQEHILESETRFRSLIEEAPIATMLMVGPEHTIEVANEVMIQTLGKGTAIIGQPATDAVPELASQGYLQVLNHVFTSGTTYETKAMPRELVINGVTQLHYFDFTYKPLHNQAGQIYGIISMAIDVTEQVLVQQKTVEAQRELLALFEQSPIGLATISADDELVFQWANPFYGQLVARKPEQLVGKPLLVALPEIEGQGFDSILKNVIATGNPFVAPEVAVDILRGGQLITTYVDLTYQPRRGAQGDIQGILVVATDVTQQVMTRRKVEENESKLRAILATAPAGIGLFVGRDLVIETPNQTFIDIVGKGPAIEGLPLREAMPELITEGQPFLQILDDVFTTGEPFISPGSLVRIVQNGVLRDNYYNISYSPVRNAAGEIYAILDIAIDVTQEVKARQQLQETEATLRGAIAVADMGTWTLDMTTGHTTYSKRLKELFEFGQDHIELDRLYNPILEADRSRLAEAVARAANPESDGILDEEYTVITQQTGRNRIVWAQAQMYFDTQGHAYKLVGTMRDVTQERQTQLALEQQVQQRTEELASINEELAATNEELASSNEEYVALNEELEEANSLLTRSNDNLQTFAYVASHDLQEPLRKIQQFGNLLSIRQAALSSEEQMYIERMQSAASRMSTLIRDLLNFSRISTQRDANKSVSLNEIINQNLITLDLVIAETKAQVEIGPLPTVQGDAAQLDILFQNLLSNALKFRRTDSSGYPVPPAIQINAHMLGADQLPPSVKPTRATRTYHQIDVVDNGIGFDEKYLDRIFQVFQRLHSKNEFSGTGIGLAICERVVTNHGGAITASSQLGKGATFSMYLPV